jgi:hypothetical protein
MPSAAEPEPKMKASAVDDATDTNAPAPAAESVAIQASPRASPTAVDDPLPSSVQPIQQIATTTTQDLEKRVMTVEETLDELERSRTPRLDIAVKAGTAFSLFSALVAVVLTYSVDMKVATLQEQANQASAAKATADRDATVMKDFAELYEKHPKLAIRFAGGIRNVDLRNALLHNTIWEALEENIDADTGPVWDVKHASWHLVGDAAYMLNGPATEQAQAFARWWKCDLRGHTVQVRWPQHRKKLEETFTWLERTYKLPGNNAQTQCE